MMNTEIHSHSLFWPRSLFWILFLIAVLCAPLAFAQSTGPATREDVDRLLSTRTYYEIFNLPIGHPLPPGGFTENPELKKKLRSLKIQFHPDRAHGDASEDPRLRVLATRDEVEKALNRVLEAADRLSDERKRLEYDASIGLATPSSASRTEARTSSRPSQAETPPQPVQPLDENEVTRFENRLSRTMNLKSYLNGLIENESDLLDDRNFQEALVRSLRQEADQRMEVSKPSSFAGSLLRKAKSLLDPWHGFEEMEPRELSDFLIRAIEPTEGRALVLLLVLDRTDPAQSPERFEALRTLLLIRSEKMVGELLKRPLYERYASEASLNEAFEHGPKTLRSLGLGEYSGQLLLEVLLDARLKLAAPEERLGRELAFHANVLNSSEWKALLPQSHVTSAGKVREILNQHPEYWPSFQSYASERLKTESGALFTFTRTHSLEALLADLEPEFTQARSSTRTAQTAAPAQETSPESQQSFLQSLRQTGRMVRNLFRRGDQCAAMFQVSN